MSSQSEPTAVGAVDPVKGPLLTVESSRDGSDHVIRLEGELDLMTVGQLDSELRAAEIGEATAIVIDLGGLSFMDSTGLSLILAAHERSGANGNRLALRRGPETVHRVFTLTGTAERLPFVD